LKRLSKSPFHQSLRILALLASTHPAAARSRATILLSPDRSPPRSHEIPTPGARKIFRILPQLTSAGLRLFQNPLGADRRTPRRASWPPRFLVSQPPPGYRPQARA